MVLGHECTSNIPSSVRRTSEAGHSGRDRVVRRSWTKLSNNGLKSSSTLPAQHLGGGREGGREGERRGREGGRERGEGGREEGRERGREDSNNIVHYIYSNSLLHKG